MGVKPPVIRTDLVPLRELARARWRGSAEKYGRSWLLKHLGVEAKEEAADFWNYLYHWRKLEHGNWAVYALLTTALSLLLITDYIASLSCRFIQGSRLRDPGIDARIAQSTIRQGEIRP